jgi:uncharacterized protein YjeT (DUF2065 family)
MNNGVFLAAAVVLVLIAGLLFAYPERCRESGIAPFAQAPVWLLRSAAIAAAVFGLYAFYRFLDS